MMAFDFSEERRRRPKVSLTSLIDVIFILIVFFMLVSSFSHYRVIDLVKGGTGAGGGTLALHLSLSAEGVLSTGNGTPVEEALALAVSKDQPVSVYLAQAVPIQQGVDALDRLKAMGVKAVTLVPEARDEVR
nr:biopolymer transporter ExbD [uncultured Cohaesibacter sp.]